MQDLVIGGMIVVRPFFQVGFEDVIFSAGFHAMKVKRSRGRGTM